MGGMRLSPDVVALAKELGHTHAELETNAAGRHRVTCNCGYVSTYRNTRADAFGALGHHLALVTGAELVNGGGVSRRKSVGGVL
jgi:hypothetical protein